MLSNSCSATDMQIPAAPSCRSAQVPKQLQTFIHQSEPETCSYSLPRTHTCTRTHTRNSCTLMNALYSFHRKLVHLSLLMQPFHWNPSKILSHTHTHTHKFSSLSLIRLPAGLCDKCSFDASSWGTDPPLAPSSSSFSLLLLLCSLLPA